MAVPQEPPTPEHHTMPQPPSPDTDGDTFQTGCDEEEEEEMDMTTVGTSLHVEDPFPYETFQRDLFAYRARPRNSTEWQAHDRARLQKFFICYGGRGTNGDAGATALTEWANTYGAATRDCQSIWSFKQLLLRATEPFYTTLHVGLPNGKIYPWPVQDPIRAFAAMLGDEELMSTTNQILLAHREKRTSTGEREFASWATCDAQRLLEEDHRERVAASERMGAAADATPVIVAAVKGFADGAAISDAGNLKLIPIVHELCLFPLWMRYGAGRDRGADPNLRVTVGMVPQPCEVMSREDVRKLKKDDNLLAFYHAFYEASLRSYKEQPLRGTRLRVAGPGAGKRFDVHFHMALFPADTLQANEHCAQLGHGTLFPCRICWVHRERAALPRSACDPSEPDPPFKTNEQRAALGRVMRRSKEVQASQYSMHADVYAEGSLFLDTAVVGTKQLGLSGASIPDVLHTQQVQWRPEGRVTSATPPMHPTPTARVIPPRCRLPLSLSLSLSLFLSYPCCLPALRVTRICVAGRPVASVYGVRLLPHEDF